MIAAVAWRHQAALLARDIDLTRLAEVMGITIDSASTEA
jgi:predicted nucleic acid-binding protein